MNTGQEVASCTQGSGTSDLGVLGQCQHPIAGAGVSPGHSGKAAAHGPLLSVTLAFQINELKRNQCPGIRGLVITTFSRIPPLPAKVTARVAADTAPAPLPTLLHTGSGGGVATETSTHHASIPHGHGVMSQQLPVPAGSLVMLLGEQQCLALSLDGSSWYLKKSHTVNKTKPCVLGWGKHAGQHAKHLLRDKLHTYIGVLPEWMLTPRREWDPELTRDHQASGAAGGRWFPGSSSYSTASTL